MLPKRTQSFDVVCPRCGKCRSIGYQGYMHMQAGRTQGFCKSCRAWRLETSLARELQSSKFHSVWVAMRQRCSNPHDKSYLNYGARGISVCARWESFDSFVEDMYPGYAPGLTIERRDVNGNYEPSNCTWLTRLEQGANKTNNRMITIDGRTQHLAAWLSEARMQPATFYRRLKLGEQPEIILTSARHLELLTWNGKSQSLAAWSRETGVKQRTIGARLRRGWPVDQALSIFDGRKQRRSGLSPTPDKRTSGYISCASRK